MISNDAGDWWAFKLLANSEPPATRWKSSSVTTDAPSSSPIDQFIASGHAAHDLTPNPPADRRTLCRRAFLVMTGLPPSPSELQAFLDDESGDAYERLVDRLLASQRFGERWARHWLDVARFAESFGFEQDYDRPYAYHYRDFVIKAFNADMPFDQFTRWQIAGDELAPDEPLAWMATGFLGAGAFPTQLTEAEFESARYDELDDMASTTGLAFLGMSIGCARCHDHKFDPIPQGDYYRFASTFTTAIRSNREFDLRTDAEKAKAAPFEKAYAELNAKLEAAKGTPQAAEIEKQLAEQKKSWPSAPTTAMIVSEGVSHIPHHADERGFPHFYEQTYYLTRGEVAKKQGVAEPGFLQVVSAESDEFNRWFIPPPEGSKTSHRRAALARWMTDVEHGAGRLLARVIVNRLWQHYFGRGIVATPSDFGAQGEPPTDPELLDWLASELIRNDWRLKPIHRLIATSQAFRQSSDFDALDAANDPTNDRLWRFAPRRLEAEAIRDSMLAASGRLDPAMFGPGTLDDSTPRRSIYLFIKRSQPIASLQLFDSPEPLVSQGRRPTTTTGPGALWFLNNASVRRCAADLADKMLKDGGDDPVEVIRCGYLMTLCREPTSMESANALEFITMQKNSYQSAASADVNAETSQRLAMIDFAQVLLSLNEFVYLE